MNRKKQIYLICQFLKTWRTSRHISQEQVLHSTRIDVSNYETGRCEPGLYNMMKLSDFYGFALPWLLKSAEDTDSGALSESDFLNQANAKRNGRTFIADEERL